MAYTPPDEPEVDLYRTREERRLEREEEAMTVFEPSSLPWSDPNANPLQDMKDFLDRAFLRGANPHQPIIIPPPVQRLIDKINKDNDGPED